MRTGPPVVAGAAAGGPVRNGGESLALGKGGADAWAVRKTPFGFGIASRAPQRRSARAIHRSARIQINTMGRAKYHLWGFPFSHIPAECLRLRSNTSFGISFRVRAARAGSNTRSSKSPSTGMKSGMRSTGESAYATVIPARTFARMGVSASFRDRKNGGDDLLAFLCAFFQVHSRFFIMLFLTFSSCLAMIDAPSEV